MGDLKSLSKELEKSGEEKAFDSSLGDISALSAMTERFMDFLTDFEIDGPDS
jgi:hypothetical protein